MLPLILSVFLLSQTTPGGSLTDHPHPHPQRVAPESPAELYLRQHPQHLDQPAPNTDSDLHDEIFCARLVARWCP